jgi:GDPmannose 4,6-dehydratase
MWLMLQQSSPDDYVVATGESHSVKEFVEAAFDYLNLRYEDHMMLDENLYRPAEVNTLRGDSTKAEAILGWKPSIGFSKLVRMMVNGDLERNGKLNLQSSEFRGHSAELLS